MEATCKLGDNGCWNDGKCRATCNCENKIITKADRVRAMSDEALAMLFTQHEYAIAKEVLAAFNIDIIKMEYDPEEAAANILEQLRQPAEE